MKLAECLIRGVEKMGVEVISPQSEAERSAIVSLRMPEGESSEDIAHRLQSEFSILVTSRSGMLRISPHIDNDIGDIESFLSALRGILQT